MLRTIWAVLVAFVVTIPLASLVLLIAAIRSTSPLIDPVIRFWARLLLRAAGVDLRTERMETIDRKQRYILVANHYSYFDIPVILAAVPQPIRFMAKISLFKIPIFGWALGRTGFIPIDRKNRRTAVNTSSPAIGGLTRRERSGRTARVT